MCSFVCQYEHSYPHPIAITLRIHGRNPMWCVVTLVCMCGDARGVNEGSVRGTVSPRVLMLPVQPVPPPG